MIDDDYELAVATQRGFDAMQEEAFPDLAPSTYAGPAADWVPRIAPSVAGPVTASFSTDGVRLEWKLMSLAPARTARHRCARQHARTCTRAHADARECTRRHAMRGPERERAPGPHAHGHAGMGTVFHVSWAHVANPKRILLKHLAQMVYPHSCSVKWLDTMSALLLVRTEGFEPVPEQLALEQVDRNNTRDLAVVRLGELAQKLQSAPSQQALTDYKGRAVRRMGLPSAGEFRFLVAQLHHAALTPIDGEAGAGDGSEDEDNALYQNWLQTRWKAKTGAALRAQLDPDSPARAAQQAAAEGGEDAGWGAEGAYVCCDLPEAERAKVPLASPRHHAPPLRAPAQLVCLPPRLTGPSCAGCVRGR